MVAHFHSFSFTSPYKGCWLEHFYRRGAMDLFGTKVTSVRHLHELLNTSDSRPDLMIAGNFICDRHEIQNLCRDHDIDIIYSEDGFFPHYQTLHADPLGFAWESSLCRTKFRHLSDHQRSVSQAKRSIWLDFRKTGFPPQIRRPYVLWPLQLIGDNANRCDLNLSDWSPLLRHFRRVLPMEFQLAVKPHPRAKPRDFARETCDDLDGVCILPRECDLRTLIAGASAVAGANSSVLLEARLMFHKPVFAYARSWFTDHPDLFIPLVYTDPSTEISCMDRMISKDWISSDYLNDYTDWFLYQLLNRQLDHDAARCWERLHQWTIKRTYKSFVAHGEGIFQ
jgi:hypothetical protein